MIAGVGIQLTERKGRLIVTGLVGGGAAARDGQVRTGDMLQSIDSERCGTLVEARRLLLGDEGTVVRLVLERPRSLGVRGCTPSILNARCFINPSRQHRATTVRQLQHRSPRGQSRQHRATNARQLQHRFLRGQLRRCQAPCKVTWRDLVPRKRPSSPSQPRSRNQQNLRSTQGPSSSRHSRRRLGLGTQKRPRLRRSLQATCGA